MVSSSQRITLKTLTPLWTGGVDQTCDRLHETGLIGSLRWWYEALVRGLGGYACDPTSEDPKVRCEYDPRKPDPPEKQLCAACYLFGCTGWGRKFRLRVLNEQGQPIEDALAKKDITFHLEFLELRPITEEEKWLLTKSVEIAARYGALGGKTTLKPQKGPMGEDFGIISWIGASPTLQRPNDIQAFLQRFRQKKNVSGHPDLRYFFFVSGGFLSRLKMNSLMGLDGKGRPLESADEVQKFLQGKRGTSQSDAISKKLFSFRADGGRIWGYARDAQMRGGIIKRIKQLLGQGNYTVKTGEEVLHELRPAH
ncbi:MAG: type III-B CRISPR module RAMP protein Cmr1 [Candidatus Roseilinea sp.]|nr:MAG: type III-B CRISPR module RAMP protein Cmr1 [Candidatus Roseilinea sp.]